MSDSSLEKRGKALEDEYFRRKDAEALERLAAKIRKESYPSPIDGKPLKQEALGPAVVFCCESSGGVWIEEDELKVLFDSKGSDPKNKFDLTLDFIQKVAERSKSEKAHGKLKAALQNEVVRISPSSALPMDKLEVGGVVLDRCPKSGGIWFDSGELEEFLAKSANVEQGEDFFSNWVNLFFKGIGYS